MNFASWFRIFLAVGFVLKSAGASADSPHLNKSLFLNLHFVAGTNQKTFHGLEYLDTAFAVADKLFTENCNVKIGLKSITFLNTPLKAKFPDSAAEVKKQARIRSNIKINDKRLIIFFADPGDSYLENRGWAYADWVLKEVMKNVNPILENTAWMNSIPVLQQKDNSPGKFLPHEKDEVLGKFLAHEIGHILGLRHSDGAEHIMDPDYQGDSLTPEQCQILRASPLMEDALN